jgi:HAD superfamily phosphoserine phosphatase-like hydrolase
MTSEYGAAQPKKRLAVFDFDGTLSKGYSAIEFMNYLVGKKSYPQKNHAEQMDLMDQHRQGKLSYADWCLKWGETWAAGLKGQNFNDISEHAQTFFQGFKKNIYPESYGIVRLLKDDDYHVACLSLGAIEIIALAAENLGMDEAYGTATSVDDGIYTGKILTNLHSPGGKEAMMKKLLADYLPDRSIGMGDSDSDIEFMGLARIPVAANPSEKLRQYAKRKNWTVLDFNGRSENTGAVISRLKQLL